LFTLKAVGIFDHPANSPLAVAALNNAAGRAVGVVRAPADLRPSGCYYTLDVETLELFDDDAGAQSAQGTLLIQTRFPKNVSPHISAQPGDRIRVTGRFHALPSARVPGAFDYGEFLRNHGVDALKKRASSRKDARLMMESLI
jgi:hypothetical protein